MATFSGRVPRASLSQEVRPTSSRARNGPVGRTSRLDRAFYARPTLVVARELLGKTLVHVSDEVRRSGRIVETEAYIGPDDAASHARSGPKGRASLMYGKAGVAYVYLVYGMHNCFNATTERDGYPGAVLVRAIEPIENADRGTGPALVCKTLDIDRSCSGVDLTEDDRLFIENAEIVKDEDVRVGPRIGVDYAGHWAAHPWRFWVADSVHLSRRRVTGATLDPAMLR